MADPNGSAFSRQAHIMLSPNLRANKMLIRWQPMGIEDIAEATGISSEHLVACGVGDCELSEIHCRLIAAALDVQPDHLDLSGLIRAIDEPKPEMHRRD